MGKNKTNVFAVMGGAMAGTTVVFVAAGALLAHLGIIQLNTANASSIDWQTLSSGIPRQVQQSVVPTPAPVYASTLLTQLTPPETPVPTSAPTPTSAPEPTATETPTPIPTPAMSAGEAAANTVIVSPSVAVPGDIIVNGGKAYTLFSGGVTLPFGASPVDFLMGLTSRPDLAKFVYPKDIQPGDIYILNDKAYTYFGNGYSLDYEDPSAGRFIVTPDLSTASAVVRMKAGGVPADTQGLKNADVVLRIRPDVEVKATPTPVPTDTPIPTSTPVSTNTPAPTFKPEPTHTPVPIKTATPTLKPKWKPKARPTAIPAPIAKPTDSPTPTKEFVPTSTPMPTKTSTPVPTKTSTPAPTKTNTPAPTKTNTPTPSRRPTVTPTPHIAVPGDPDFIGPIQETPIPSAAPTPIPHIAVPGDSDFIGPIQQTRGSVGRSGSSASKKPGAPKN